jgi:hypothetical protein
MHLDLLGLEFLVRAMPEGNLWVPYQSMVTGDTLWEVCYEPGLAVVSGTIHAPPGIGLPTREWLRSRRSQVRPELFIRVMEALQQARL